MTSEAQLSSISKNKQKSFKPDLFEIKIYHNLNTRKYLKSSIVMLLSTSNACLNEKQNEEK